MSAPHSRLLSAAASASASAAASLSPLRSPPNLPLAPIALAVIRAMSSSAAATGPVAASIASKLADALDPVHLEVRNESHMHNVPPESETHFKVIIVSPKFDSVKTPLARHRMVNSILSREIASDGPVHALSVVAKTPGQWERMVADGRAEVGPSPKCRGGDGSLPGKDRGKS